MPRQSRIDTPSALHHIIARGIGRRNIFSGDQDRETSLGGSDFVEQVLAQARKTYERKQALQAKGVDENAVARRVADLLEIDIKLVRSPGKNRLIVKARSLFCCWLVSELGVSMSHLARHLGLSVTAISQSVERGKRIVAEENFTFGEVKL